MRYGRLPHDPAQVNKLKPFASVYGATHTHAPPSRLERGGLFTNPGLFGNDLNPVCTCAAVANVIDAFARAFNVTPCTLPQRFVDDLYAQTLGIDNTETAIRASNGAVYLDVIQTMYNHPMLGTGSTPFVPEISWLGTSTVYQLAQATAFCAAAVVGIRVYDEDEQNTANGRVWDSAPSSPLVGRHMAFLWDYAGLELTDPWRIEWYGAYQEVTPVWLLSRLEEAYAHVFRTLLPVELQDDYPGFLNSRGLLWAG